MEEIRPAEGFPPGELIKEELAERGWTQDDLADILGRPSCSVNEIISGKRGITIDTAKGLSEAFGTSPQFWLNMDSAYRLSLERDKPKAVARKALLFGIAPVRAMIKRNWLEPSTNIDVLEERLREFFKTDELSKPFNVSYMARKSTASISPAQNAWLYRAMNLTKAVYAENYTKPQMSKILSKLKTMLANEDDIRSIPKVLAEGGVKLLIIEPFPGSKIDGISFWDNGTPVIALSLRYDRIDSFWHTLIHELAHIKYEDGLKNNKVIVDMDLFDEPNDERPTYERRADEFAVEFLVPQAELDDFIARVHPLYTKTKIIGFAHRIGVHPGIVLGQIHFRNKDYSHNRELLVKIRNLVIDSSLTDGYGQLLPVNLN